MFAVRGIPGSRLLYLCLRFAEPLRCKRPGPAAPLDEIEAENTQAYLDKMNRWYADVAKAIAKAGLWITVAVQHRARMPLDHFLNVLRKYKPARGEDRHSALAVLVFGKAAQIAGEFDELLDPALWDPITDDMPVGLLRKIYKGIVHSVLSNAADYNRRVTCVLNRFPYILLEFARSPPEVSCQHRQRVARLLLDGPSVQRWLSSS